MIIHNGNTDQKKLDDLTRDELRKSAKRKTKKLTDKVQRKRKKNFPLADVLSQQDAKLLSDVSEALADDELDGGLDLESPAALVEALTARSDRRVKASDQDFVDAYTTVIKAPDDNGRRILYEAACTVLDKKRYKNSNLFSITLQAMGFEPDAASKRGKIALYALRERVSPTKLLQFVKDCGGVEECVNQARLFQRLSDGKLKIGIMNASEKDEKPQALFMFDDEYLLKVVLTLFRPMPKEVLRKGALVDEKTLIAALRKAGAKI